MIAYLACKVYGYWLESRTDFDAPFNGAKKNLHGVRNQDMLKMRGTYRYRRLTADNHNEVAAEEKDN